MIDTNSEQVVSFAEATQLIPGHPHLSQVYRWAMRGLRGVKLEWVKVGGKRFTSVEALTRFYEKLTAADGGAQIGAAQIHHQHEQAEKELQEAGI